ncbi:ribosome biogenesis protein BMS1 homolog isoform X1 [Chlorocebus sabaeus]|uniref:ribosome biogenesis protein BMS1 homolog isoform X1 n=1 Tax=Chlorocebus sabaeus TaxID=60711 RepID=UPI00045DF0E3|nr:ribosome biogenesis protein BMS1 homolog isoform X3 [Chlorocebus sabaeus]
MPGREIPKLLQFSLLWGWLNPFTGVEDFAMSDIGFLPDPCALPEQRKNKKEQLVYVPFSGVGRVLYDKDAIYVDLGGSHGFQAQLWSLTLLPIQRQAQYTMGTVKEMLWSLTLLPIQR